MGLTKLQNEIIQIVKQRRESRKLKNKLLKLWVRINAKMTLAKNLPQIDSLYVYNIGRETPFHHREQPDEGYRYKNRNAIISSKENEIHIYHQSAVINGVIKGITLVTLDNNDNSVKKFFKNAIEEIGKDEGKLAIFNKASKPVQVDIFHLY